MIKSIAPLASAAFFLAVATAASLPDGSWPASKGTVQYSQVYTVKAGEVFDGMMKTYERSDILCAGQATRGTNTAVFLVEAGGTLKNVIIGKNQMDGVRCDYHACIIENVWWNDVCNEALSIRGGIASSVSKVIGGGARYAHDKVIMHIGYGKTEIDGFYGEDISMLYRSCGEKARKVSVSNVYVVNPTDAFVTVNKNWGDQATLNNIWVKSSKRSVKVCQWSQGTANGKPIMLGNGPSNPLCQYAESDVHINNDMPQAAPQPPSSTGNASQTVVQSSVRSGDAAGNATPFVMPVSSTESGINTKVPTSGDGTKQYATKSPTDDGIDLSFASSTILYLDDSFAP